MGAGALNVKAGAGALSVKAGADGLRLSGATHGREHGKDGVGTGEAGGGRDPVTQWIVENGLYSATLSLLKNNSKEYSQMAASMMSSAAIAPVSRATTAQATMIAPFIGLKSVAGFPGTRKVNTDITSITSNGGRVKCMKVWPPVGLKKFETLSYLPPLTPEQLGKEIDYLIRMGWVPCIEFELEHGFVYREHNKSPGYYDGRYWTMWKLPMFGCTDSSQVLKELEEAKTEYPNAFLRIIGFDNKRQVQCISFIAYKPPGN